MRNPKGKAPVARSKALEAAILEAKVMQWKANGQRGPDPRQTTLEDLARRS